MNKILLGLLPCLLISGCAESVLQKQSPVCQATALLGGQQETVQIYGVRKVANQTEFRAGHPFNWRWVNKNNFSSNTCK
ncbi:phage exclusion lipoprotein Cor [Leclercia sp. UBA7405]|uniref:phage exclusion lipoprotein Cor n=1 Tax=Leclercia sp. UBA7405 TaxID=1946743 RepID=UPI0030192B4F